MVKKLDAIGYKVSRFLNRRPSAIRDSVIDKTASIGNGAQIVGCEIGRYSYVFGSQLLYAKVGAFCSIAANVVVGGGLHPLDWVSSSPAFYKGKNVLYTNFSHNEFEEYVSTTIGNDVWIGSHVLVKGGVTIGDGAVIGMGSVVTHDVPPYEIWAGNPARCIRKRFDDETIAKLQELQWWNWDDKKLKQYGDLFDKPETLLKQLEKDV